MESALVDTYILLTILEVETSYRDSEWSSLRIESNITHTTPSIFYFYDFLGEHRNNKLCNLENLLKLNTHKELPHILDLDNYYIVWVATPFMWSPITLPNILNL